MTDQIDAVAKVLSDQTSDVRWLWPWRRPIIEAVIKTAHREKGDEKN